MYKNLAIIYLSLVYMGCQSGKNQVERPFNADEERSAIVAMLDSFNVAAGRADFEGYFSFYDSSSVFMGTDATERWDKPDFMAWSKPFFDR